jgi:hypothetical protein
VDTLHVKRISLIILSGFVYIVRVDLSKFLPLLFVSYLQTNIEKEGDFTVQNNISKVLIIFLINSYW